MAGGVVSAWKRVVTKAGKLMATFRLEDMTASWKCWSFPSYTRRFTKWPGTTVVVVKGRLDTAEEEKKLLASQIRWLS